MNRGREAVLCNSERLFTLESIRERKRLDGRTIYDYRHVTITPSHVTPGNVLVLLGDTRVQACITCELAVPRQQRPTDGLLYFNVMLEPMASPHYEIGARSSLTIKIERLLDRCFKESRSVDTESLCIIAGQKVWSIKVDLHVLNDSGNVTDCCVLASLTALKHFRRPDVTVIGEEATIHPVTEREPVPLNIHHFPICVTFGFCDNGEDMVVDPTHLEEQVLSGQLSLVMNIHREICTMQLEGGVALLPDQVIRCTKIALKKVSELNDLIKASLSPLAKETNGQSILTSKLKESSRVIETEEDNDEVLIVVDEFDEEEENDVTLLEDKIGELPCVIAAAVASQEVPSNKREQEMDSEEEETIELIPDNIKSAVASEVNNEKEIVTKKGRKRKKKVTT